MTNAQKTPLVKSLSAFAQSTAEAEIRKRGLALPGRVVAVDGPIVTVSFEVKGATLPQVKMPLFGPEYIRYPVQAGDLGVAFPASVYLGGVSGLGNGTADMTLRGNLSTLVWFPVGNKKWTEPPNGNANSTVIYGPGGVVIEDTTGASKIVLTPTGITLSCGGHTIVINSAGVTIDGRVFLAHEHTPGTYVVGSSPVTNNSGGVV